MKESEIEKKTCDYAKGLGYLTYKFISPNNRGVPDRIFMKNGKCFFIEFKVKGEKPSKMQQKVIEKMKSHKIMCFVVNSFNRGRIVITAMESTFIDVR